MPGDERVEARRWTIYVCPICGKTDSEGVTVCSCVGALEHVEVVEVAALDALPDPEDTTAAEVESDTGAFQGEGRFALPDRPPGEETDPYRFYERAREAEARVAVLQRQVKELREALNAQLDEMELSDDVPARVSGYEMAIAEIRDWLRAKEKTESDLTPEEATQIRQHLLATGVYGAEWDAIWAKLRRLAARDEGAG